jgi:hypothetical protein
MFGLSRSPFVGSYFFLNSTRRASFGPYAALTSPPLVSLNLLAFSPCEKGCRLQVLTCSTSLSLEMDNAHTQTI